MNLEDLDVCPSSCNPRIIFNTNEIKNPFTGGLKFVRMPGSRWEIEVGYTLLKPEQARYLEAIVASLKGGAVFTRVRDFTYAGNQLLKDETVSIDGNGQTGNTLKTKGWSKVGEIALEKGAKISWIDPDTGLEELHIVTASGIIANDGKVTLTVEPEIKRSTTTDQTIELIKPGCSAYLKDDGGGLKRSSYTSSWQLKFQEAIYGF